MTLTRALSTAWICLVVALVLASVRRDSAPGDAGAPPPDWPIATTLRPDLDGPTLVMVAHPRCPCTLASLDALERLLAGASRPVRAYLLLTVPEGATPEFASGEALERARRLSGVIVVLDADGRETARFGARTSGHVLAFDADGHLRFAGGITPSRGHRGDAPGRRALAALLAGAPAVDAAPVFGCPLEDEK